jgi:molybdopterin molybdotransferase
VPPPRRVDPLEALEAIAVHLRPGAPIELPLEEARGAYLAEPLASLSPGSCFPGDPGGLLRAARDGYAFPAAVSPGDELAVTGPARVEDPPPLLELGAACRVECGAPLPAAVHSVLPVASAVVTGTGRIRVLRPAPAGDGVAGRASGAPATLAHGTRIDGRLEAFLLARGLQRVRAYPRYRVGILIVGDELADLRAAPGPGQLPDMSGFWLPGAVALEGLEAVPLGIAGGAPAEVKEAVLRARSRRVDLLLVAGGFGEGVTDRSAEALKDFDCRIFFERLALRGCPTAFLARAAGLDVLGISGAPLAAAIAYDLLVRPALLARLGAARRLWDWGARPLPADLAGGPSPPLEPPPLEPARPAWTVLAARPLEPPHRGFEAWLPESPFSPLAAGASGWLVAPPPSGPGGEARAYFVPLGSPACGHPQG